jgi:hypothetical protein
MTLNFITAFKKTAGREPADELNADMSSSLEDNPRFQRGEDVIVLTFMMIRYYNVII